MNYLCILKKTEFAMYVMKSVQKLTTADYFVKQKLFYCYYYFYFKTVDAINFEN